MNTQYPWAKQPKSVLNAMYSGTLDDIQFDGFIIELPPTVAEAEGFAPDDTISLADALDGQEVPQWKTRP